MQIKQLLKEDGAAGIKKKMDLLQKVNVWCLFVNLSLLLPLFDAFHMRNAKFVDRVDTV